MTRTVAVLLSTLVVLSMVTATAAVAAPMGADPPTAPASGPPESANLGGGEGAAAAADAPLAPRGLSPGAIARGAATGENETNETAGDRPITETDPDRTGETDDVSELTHEIPLPSEGTFTPEPGLDPVLTDGDSEQVYALLQFARAPSAGETDRLLGLGYEEAQAATESTRYVRLPRSRLEEIAGMDVVRAVTPVRPEWRIDPALDEALAAREEPVGMSILTFEPLSGETVEAFGLQAVGNGEAEWPGGTHTYYGELAPGEIRELQRTQRVFWMDEARQARPHVAEGRRMVGAPMAGTALSLGDPEYDGTGVRVGVLDSGIEHGNPHFSEVTIVDAYDWADDDNNPEAASGCDHGTHVAGTIAGNGSTGGADPVIVTGVAPNATLVPSRIFAPSNNCEGSTTLEIAPKRKFDEVRDEGAKIISNSWGTTDSSFVHDWDDGDYNNPSKKTDKWARKHPDTLVVFSNGNSGESEYDGTPALAKNVIAVGAVRDGSRNPSGGVDPAAVNATSRLLANADSSLNDLKPTVDAGQCNSGRKKPELYAPGHWTTAPVTGGKYDDKWGTSMAAPHVSGVAALFREKYPNSRATEVRAHLVSTAAPPTYEGFGVVNANNALFTNPYESVQGHLGDSVKKGKTDEEDFRVPSDAEKVVVTLVWNDPPRTPGVGIGINCGSKGSGILANDLDLHAGPANDVERHSNRNDANVKRIVVDDPDAGRWTTRVTGHRVTLGNSQNYDVVYRVVTDDPTLSVNETSNPFSNRIEVEPWERRDREFAMSVNGTGAPVSGITAAADVPSALSTCDGWETAKIVGTLSDGHGYTDDACVTVPAPGTSVTNATVEYTVNTTNAENLAGSTGRNATREVVFEIRPRPSADRHEGTPDNDELSDAVSIAGESGWPHGHLRCYGDGAFSGGSTDGNCSSILTDPSFSSDPDDRAGAVTAYERWNVAVDNLSLDTDGDEDFYEFTLPETDTPTLPRPECGVQNVTIGGQRKQVKTSGSLRITVESTANSLGDDGVRIAGPGTPIKVYAANGSEVTTGSTTGGVGQVTREIDCPRTRGLTDLGISFGEGSVRNLGTYRIEVTYGIDVTRPNDAASINRNQAIQAAEAERMERYLVASELLGLGSECTGLDCSIVKSHPIGPEVGEDPVCRRAICRDPTFVTIRGTGAFRLSAVGHPDLRFELQDPTGEPIATSETTETFTTAEFAGVLTDLGYGQWVTGLGTERLVGLLNQPAPGSGDALALDTTGDAVVAARQGLTVDDLEPGTYRLVVEGPPGNYWLTEFDRPPVPDDGDDDDRTVRLDPPEQTVGIDRRTTVGVVVTDVDGGVGGYELRVDTSDAATARIVDADSRIGGTQRIELADDGSRAKLAAFAGDTAETGAVTLATLTLVGVEPGTAALSTTVESVSDEAGSQYAVDATDPASVTVREEPRGPEVVAGSPAGDLDGDGVYEDVNGDGEVTPGDSTVLFNAIFEGNEAVTNDPERFDLNGDGATTAGDATVLFDRVFGR